VTRLDTVFGGEHVASRIATQGDGAVFLAHQRGGEVFVPEQIHTLSVPIRGSLHLCAIQ
jgi:hypothetical protein